MCLHQPFLRTRHLVTEQPIASSQQPQRVAVRRVGSKAGGRVLGALGSNQALPHALAKSLPSLKAGLPFSIPEKAERGLFILNASCLDGFITLRILATKGWRLQDPQHHPRDGSLSEKKPLR